MAIDQYTHAALGAVVTERMSQDARFGQQDHADGTGKHGDARATDARRACDEAFTEGRGSWYHILREEVEEAFAERDADKLRAELVQVAAVAVAWVEAIERRNGGTR